MFCATCLRETAADPCGACGQPAALDRRYRLEQEIGRGRFGATWRAAGPGGATMAIKIVPTPPGMGTKLRELLAREAAVLGQLDHPGIPAFIESFEATVGQARSLCIVQGFIAGQTLAQELERHRYSPEEVLDLLGTLLEILIYLHALSPPVIHRDIKPANVIRGPDGGLALIDFGAVRDSLADPELGGSTVAGTFGYMAPEQFRGDADARTDLYALGALAVHLLTRKDPKALVDHRNQVCFQSHLRVSPAVLALLESLLDSDPERRPQTARQARALVDSARADRRPPVSGRPERPQRAAAPERPHRTQTAARPSRADTTQAARALLESLPQPADALAPIPPQRAALTGGPDALETRARRALLLGRLTLLLVLLGLLFGLLLVSTAPATPPTVQPPPGVEAMEIMELGGGHAGLDGLAVDGEAVERLVTQLRSSGRYTRVYLSTLTPQAVGDRTLWRFRVDTHRAGS